MNEIKCPHCSTVFTINETEYNQLLDQIRNHEFEKEIHARVDLELKNQKTEFDAKLRLKEAEFKNTLDNEMSTKNNEISRLNLLLNSAASNAKIENKEALLKQQLDYEEKLNKSASEIQELKTENKMLEQTLKDQYTKTISDLEHQLDSFELLKNAEINSLVKSHEVEVNLLQETIETYKDFKARQSTKAIGESLEHFAETEFNKVRSIAFPNAYFAKDNEISKSGSKGDFIFRDYMDGMEFVSIMFEMKNEADTTKSKHRNSDFYKELDKD